MSELFDQFVLEARDLLEQAGGSLLRLERNPADAEAVNDLFRALHTLKGATGLFDMVPFTRLVHAGEDVLMAVREGRATLTAGLADRLLRLLDLGAAWVDHLEAEREMPAGADAMAGELEGLLRAALSGDGGAAPGAAAAGFAWADALSEEERRDLGGLTLTAVAYDPHPECFFNGDDPLDLCRRVPDLRLIRIETAEPWPPLAEMDPYRCTLRLRVLSGAPREEVERLFRAVPDQVRVATVTVAAAPSAPGSTATAPSPQADGVEPRADGVEPLARAILRQQAQILDLAGTTAEVTARRAAVIRALRNILTALGRTDPLAALDRAAGEPDALRRFIAAQAEGQARPAPAPERASVPPARRALRVDAERMDRLMGLVGELVAAKSRLPYLARQAREGQRADVLEQGLKEAQGQIDALVDDLQDAVLRLRVLPLSRVFDPLSRLVRDGARRLGKTVELRLSGGETEADKDILDILGEPLLHLVRNSLDHGVESPDERRAAGKPATASIRVHAFQDRDGVVVEVSDDGVGIDCGAVRRKAVERGQRTEEQAAALSDAEALRLVFLPGLSTADRVTDLSGRGVGMDAVCHAVEQAGGRVEIASERGAGTLVRLRLPATMMVSSVLTVEAEGALYGVPVTLVSAMRRIPAALIRRVKHAESVVLDDCVLPLIRLRRLLGLAEDERQRGAEAVLVVDLGGQRVALVVDGFGERAEVVQKPMSGVLARLRGYAGTAVLGDGRLLLILNLRELL